MNTTKTNLSLELNNIDNLYKVIDEKGYCMGDGRTKDHAIKSARIVTDDAILDVENGKVY